MFVLVLVAIRLPLFLSTFLACFPHFTGDSRNYPEILKKKIVFLLKSAKVFCYFQPGTQIDKSVALSSTQKVEGLIVFSRGVNHPVFNLSREPR